LRCARVRELRLPDAIERIEQAAEVFEREAAHEHK